MTSSFDNAVVSFSHICKYQSMRHGFDTRILHSRSWLLASSLVWRLATDQVHMVELNNDNYTTAFSGVRSTKDLLRSGSSLSNLPLLGVPPENNGPIEYLPSYHIPALNLASSSGSPLSCSNKRGFNHNSDRLQFLNPTLNYQPVWAEGLRIPAQAQATLDSHSTYLETSTSAIQDTFSFDYGLPFPLNATQGGQPLQYYNPISLYQPSAPTTMAVHYREDSTHSTPWETSFDLPLYSNSNPSYQFYPQDDFYYRHN